MIYGAHENSEHLAQVIQSRGRYSYKVCAFITEDKKFANKYINGIKVFMKDELSIEKMREEEVEAVICEDVLRNEQELETLSYTYDEMAIVRKMKEIVPEYKSQHSRFEALDLPQ